MENLLSSNYGSSPDSTSSSSKISRSSPSSRRQQHDEHVSLLTNCEQNAVLFDHSNYSPDFGIDINCAESSACSHGNRRCQSTVGRMESSAEEKRREMNCSKTKYGFDILCQPSKRQKLKAGECSKSQTRVVISGIDGIETNKIHPLSSKVQFERTYPHWEGRWAGHIHLPFPQLETLDSVSCDSGDCHEKSALQISHDQYGDGSDLEKPAEENESTARKNGNIDNDSDGSDDNSSYNDDENVDMTQSRIFLPVARKLIQYWALVIDATTQAKERSMATKMHKNCEIKSTGAASPTIGGVNTDDEIKPVESVDVNSRVVIVPHFPMQSRSSSDIDFGRETIESYLHVSLSRPIYLPAPSVDTFLTEISKQLRAVLSVTGHNHCQPGKGIILQLQPQNTKIFTNDQRTRSFLSIPVSEGSAQWIKTMLLPRIDATMERFGQGSYYKTEEGGCILHVSIASAKGDMIKEMLNSRRSCKETALSFTSINVADVPRSTSLFGLIQEDEPSFSVISKNLSLSFNEYIPKLIPVQVNMIRCEFGKTKKVDLPLL